MSQRFLLNYYDMDYSFNAFIDKLCNENKVYNIFKGVKFGDIQLDPREMPRQWVDAARERRKVDLGGILF